MWVNFPGIEIMGTKPKSRWRKKKKDEERLKYARPCKNREPISNNDGDGYENVTFKNVTRAYSISFIVKCWQFFLELNFKGLYKSSGKEKESRWLVLMSSTKHEIGHWGFTL